MKRLIDITALATAVFIACVSISATHKKYTPQNLDETRSCYSPVKDSGDYAFVEIAGFKTDFRSSSANRKHNVRLASSKLDGKIIENNAEFSFNDTVGLRTEKNGFLPAKIIFSGRFIDGIGGGVCQVSTTLYNAAVLSGLKITEHHQHSLLVSYVPPSTDAMVNSVGCDLKFINDTGGRIYIKTFCDETSVTVKVYGKRQKYSYALISETVQSLDAQPPVYVTDDDVCKTLKQGEQKILAYGVKGAVSRAYLSCYKDGELVYTKLYRSNVYRPTPTIIAIRSEDEKVS